MTVQAGTKWIPWKRERWAIVKHFRNLRNKLEDEAVFPDDFEQIKWYDRMLEFIGNLDYTVKKNTCPLCKKKGFLVKGHIESCCFEGVEDKNMGQIEDVTLVRCLSCGFITLEEN